MASNTARCSDLTVRTQGSSFAFFEDSTSSANVDTSGKVAGQRIVLSNISKKIGLPSNGDSVPAAVPAVTAVASPAV
jgi:hypothetical protein